MQARLKTSTKWTPFPSEYVAQMKGVLEENLADLAAKGEFVVEGRIYNQELLLRVGFLERGRIKQVNFEASIEYSYDKDNALQAINTCFDAAVGLLNEYFQKLAEMDQPKSSRSTNLSGKADLDADDNEFHGPIETSLEEEMDLPYTWTAVQFEQRELFLQFTTINSSLESQADALLGEEFIEGLNKALVMESLDNEELSEAYESFDNDDDGYGDDDGGSGFGDPSENQRGHRVTDSKGSVASSGAGSPKENIQNNKKSKGSKKASDTSETDNQDNLKVRSKDGRNLLH